MTFVQANVYPMVTNPFLLPLYLMHQEAIWKELALSNLHETRNRAEASSKQHLKRLKDKTV